MGRLLERKNVPFHTFHLSEEKVLKVVLKRIPTDFSIEEVQGELKQIQCGDKKKIVIKGIVQ